ncbi:MAG: helix-turn-helix domain-containing protein, partial [Lachnospiraceae bacterium]|nr:helix-turn-helix domain-containing protein [Lachnospiraceae bacterium]
NAPTFNMQDKRIIKAIEDISVITGFPVVVYDTGGRVILCVGNDPATRSSKTGSTKASHSKDVLKDGKTLSPGSKISKDGKSLSCDPESSKDGDSKSRISEFVQSDNDSAVKDGILLMRAGADYVVEVPSEAEKTALLCVSALETLSDKGGRRPDRGSFVRSILDGDLTDADIHEGAARLKIKTDIPAVVFIIDVKPGDRTTAMRVLSSMYPNGEGHVVTATGNGYLALVMAVDDEIMRSAASAEGVSAAVGVGKADEVRPLFTKEWGCFSDMARTIADMMNAEAMIRAGVAVGDVARGLSGIRQSYFEAVETLRAATVFYGEGAVAAYGEMSTGRMMLSLPIQACRDYIRDVFGDNKPFVPDDETRVTIDAFFENSLNISETGRQLFLHRNTLVYRLEKIQKETGLDIRRFDDAMTLKLALMAEKRISAADEADPQINR